MEDTARLALIERYVNNERNYENFLNELLQLINHILENPHDRDYRRIQSCILKDLLKCNDFCEYLRYLGFEQQTNEYVLPKEQTLEKIKAAQVAIERKIIFCYGPEHCTYARPKPVNRKIIPLKPADILTTTNPFLLSIQNIFNYVLRYENNALQEEARNHIPLMALQLRAFERMREFQKKIKTGEVKAEDMSFDMALLAELLSWFKHKFFTWVDKPACVLCGGPTQLTGKSTVTINDEDCVVENYRCTRCEHGAASFPRHNEARALLRTRRGRCGEFANCFALLCRALGYDTRYVFDTADHVWCEVFDYDSNSWIHVDPCDAKLNAPLMYSHGWNKKLSYVIAVSRDDLQDVTWRYTYNHKETMSRRNRCSEAELVRCVLALRAHRQAQVSPARRRYLAKRALCELVQLLQERKPEDYESEGRLSGSIAWRRQRGEIGTRKGHVFDFNKPGSYAIRYYTSSDRYKVSHEDQEIEKILTWASGLFDCKNMFRKVEMDWKQVYLAREEGEPTGLISWKLAVANTDQQMAFQSLCIRVKTTLYETGKIEWTLKFDDHSPKVVKLGDYVTQYNRTFRTATLTCSLSGGLGDVAWQHAQLFGQPSDSDYCTFELLARLQHDQPDLD